MLSHSGVDLPLTNPQAYLTQDNGYRFTGNEPRREPRMIHLIGRPFVNNETHILKGVQFQHIHYL